MGTLANLAARHRRRSAIRFFFILALWMMFCLGVAGLLNQARAETPQPLPHITTCTPVGFGYEYLPLGRHLAVVCTKPLGDGVYVNGISCLHAACSPATFGMAIIQVITSSSPKAELEAQWAKHIKWTCDAPPDQAAVDLCAERKKWVNSKWAEWTAGFKPAVWRVKANGSKTSRPAYELINGVLGTKEVARATVGVLCDVSRPTAPATNGDIRAEFGTAGVVTICARSP